MEGVSGKSFELREPHFGHVPKALNLVATAPSIGVNHGPRVNPTPDDLL